ncbi:MAG: putative sporulation-specific glycosylase YdhD [candidate division WS6 bacterium OLB20]|uniref:Putative sporulation-specific glycosylase YdhD n=1 Tax=candidate division WS6 bacterium OLB20 TaxID=1617426 RepID=A0A136M0M5_9BACT|nr:MAG: putative sporulation-specific glycosylase YdhD [candidate division WS6 bacterium OLB20]
MQSLRTICAVLLIIVSGTACVQPLPEDQDTPPEAVPVATGKPLIHGWIPHWEINAGIDTMESYPLFASVSPVWYEVGAGGTLLPVGGDRDPLIRYSAQTETQLIPSIASFDHNTFSSLAATDEQLYAHADAILAEVDRYGYDGIDLDYESVKLEDGPAYMTLIRTLAEELHAREKLLSVTVLAKWGDQVAYGYRPETRAVQDWTEIAVHADQLRIMTYDFTYQGATYPGPIAPESWVRAVTEYAIEKAPREKLILGVPTYAYEWFQPQGSSETLLQFEPNGLTNPQSESGNARSYPFSTVERILAEYPGESVFFQGEHIYRYKRSGEDRVVVFTDPQGILDRYRLAEEYGLAGISFWRLGEEGDLYSDLSSYLD